MWHKSDARHSAHADAFFDHTQSASGISRHYRHHLDYNTTMHALETQMAERHHNSPNVLWLGGNSRRRKRWEPFCSPVVPHIPIRQRLAKSRRCASVDVNDEGNEQLMSTSSMGYISNSGINNPRPRRMSLLQSLRYQNKQLADSQDSATYRDFPYETPSKHGTESPPNSPTKNVSDSPRSASRQSSSFASIKAKTQQLLFGKKKKSSKSLEISENFMRSLAIDDKGEGESPATALYTTIDRRSIERRQTSPNDDSGRGSQPTTATASTRATASPRETTAIIERTPPDAHAHHRGCASRSVSCPNLGCNLRIYHELSRAFSMHPTAAYDGAVFKLTPSDHQRRANSVDCDSIDDDDEIVVNADKQTRSYFDERMLRNSSPISAADHLLERRMYRRAQLVRHREEHPVNGREKHYIRNFRLQRPSPIARQKNSPNANDDMNNNADRIAEKQNGHSGEIAARPAGKMQREGSGLKTNDADRVSDDDDGDEDVILDDTASTVLLDQYLPCKTRKAFLPFDCRDSNRSSSISSVLNRSSIDDDDSHSEYHSSSDRVASVAQTDLSLVRISDQLSTYLTGLQMLENGGTAKQHRKDRHFFDYQSFVNLPYKTMQLHKTPFSQSGPPDSWAPRFAHRAGKHQPAPNSRAVRRNADSPSSAGRHSRTSTHDSREWGDRHGELRHIDSSIESRLMAADQPILPERHVNSNSTSYSPRATIATDDSEVLVILTYASGIEFVTATVKKAKALPYNNDPFARVMLFDGRKLLEQKQTTITTSAGGRTLKQPVNGRHSSSSSSCGSGRSLSNSRVSTSRSIDASFSESFLFHVPSMKLDRCHVVIELFDRDSSNAVFPVGHCVIGPMSHEGGSQHWQEMVRKAGFPICMWHRIAHG